MITGSLQKKNGSYYAALNLKVDGKRKVKWIATGLPVEGTSIRKAQKALDQIRAAYEKLEEEQLVRSALETQRRLNPDAELMFQDYMAKWLKSSRSTIAATTYTSYNDMVQSRITTWFTAHPVLVRELTAEDINNFYDSILADNCTTNTVIHYHAIIRKALQNAVRRDVISKNPADQANKPKKNVFLGSFYSEEEMMTLFDVADGDPLEVPIKIAAYYGLRRSEVLGLKWDAIDFDKKTVSIRHKVVELQVDGKSVTVGEDVLKTKSSFRTLPLIPAVEELLLNVKEKQEMYKALFKKSYCPDYIDYVCVDQLGKILRPNYLTEHFAWLLEKYGLRKIRFHDLRHSCASLLLQNGISMKQIQIWLGHSTFSTTADIYAHLDYTAQEESAATMGSLFKKDRSADKKAAAGQ